MDAARVATMGMSSALRDLAVAAQSVSGVTPTNPNSLRTRVEETDTRRGAVGSTLPGGPPDQGASPAVEAYRLPVGGSVGLDPDLMQQFTPLSSDGLDVTQGMVSMIIGRQAFQANRNAYQAAQSLLDATLKVGL
jgi:hypothetical protein